MTGIKNINKETMHYDKITGKLGLSLLLLFLLLPFLSVSYLLNTELNSETRFIAQQKAGFAYIDAVRSLLEHMQQHRGMAHASHNGTNEFESQLPGLVARIDEDVRVVESMYATFRYLSQSNGEWIAWRNNWLKLQQAHLQMSAADHFAAHSELIDELLASIREAVDVFRLTLDTQQDSRNLAEAVMQMPWQMEYMAQMRGLGTGIVARGRISANERVRLRALGQSIRVGQDDLVRNMTLLFQRNPSLQARLSPVLDKSINSINHFLSLVLKQITDSVVLQDVSTRAYFNTGTMVLDDFSRLFAAIESELDALLMARLENTQHKRMLLQVSTLLILAVTIVIYFIFLRHQAVLSESKQKIQAIVENAADSIVTINEQGIIQSFNPAAEKMFGYSVDEVMEQNVRCLMPAAERHRHDSYMHRYLESGQGHIIGIGAREVEARRHDGSIFPIDLSISEMQQADGKRLFIGILRDITRRKQAEAEINKLARFVVNNPGTVLKVSADYEILFANPASKTLLESLHLKPGDQIPQRWQACIDAAFESRELQHFEEIINEKTNLLTITYIDDTSVNIYGVDISKRKHAEADLRASEERFEMVTRGTKDGIWDWNLTTGQIYFSPRWKAMLGYDETDIMDNFMSLQNLIHPDDLGLALDNWTSCMEGETDAFAIEYRLRTKLGNYRWIECRGLAQLDIKGNPVRIAGSHSDITERKQAYTELQQMTNMLAIKAAALDLSNKELEQFAYIASHDLKAPLRAIANLSQWIEEDLDEAMTDDSRQQMALLRGRVLRMEGLINGILQYSRVGHMDTEIEMVDVAQLLDEVLDGLAPPTGFHIDIAPDMPVLQTARIPLSQIFSNLLSNAIKYHDRPESAQITVSVRSLNDMSYEFTVADDGPGIAPEYHDKVFQIFQTLNARDTVESTGIGLTVVKKIVEQLGGEITLESVEGKGTIFRFTLPQNSDEERETSDEMQNTEVAR